MPALFETVVLKADGHENAPESDAPYYLLTDEAYFLYKPTQIGHALLPQYTKPKGIGKLGYKGGVFEWKGDKIPGHIISQAHDFFLRIFNTKHSEAEVLITKHNDDNTYRLFVPYQRVSHSGVKSIYEPTHVDRHYTVVGTLHSHCDFTAFHSGTDSGDASDMDGVHFTIGKVNLGMPEIVAMVAMNGKEFHYTDPTDIAEVIYGSRTAPEWWDQYVFTGSEAPAIKPRGLVSLTQEHWDEFLGRALVKPKPAKTLAPHVVSSPDAWKTNWRKSDYKWTGDTSQFDWRREVYGAGPASNVRTTKVDPTLLDIALDEAERFNLISEEDWDDCPDNLRDDPAYWQGFFLNKMESARDVLATLGIEYVVGRPSKKGKK